MYKIDLQLPGSPARSELESALEAVTDANSRWYLEEWQAGRDPPCCCDCAGVAYRPDDPSNTMRVWGLPFAFSRPHASCHTAATVHAGRSRAIEIEKGASQQEATARHHVVLEYTQPKEGAPQWHAYYKGPRGVVDVTGKMKRWAGS